MNVELCIGQKRTADICRQMFTLLGEPAIDEFGGLRAFDYPSKGTLVYVNEQDDVVTIFLYPDGVDGYTESIFVLPKSLRFDQSRQQVREFLGAPSQSGRNNKGRDWDKFEFPNYALHAEYSEKNGMLRQVTIMTSLSRMLSE